MATWHITVKPTVGVHNQFQSAIHSLVITPYVSLFTQSGFTVNPMPESASVALSVSHSSESAITLFMLRHAVEDIDITRVI